MESIYYVLCWHCHRRCKHCYEDRFYPYVRDELESVVAEAERNAPKIVAHLPQSMTYLDRNAPADNAEGFQRKTGRIIISGGDVLTDPVRERVLYPTLEAIRNKYRDKGGVKVVVQTTGDLLTPEIIEELLKRDVWCISVSGMDDFHVGLQGKKRNPLIKKLKAMFAVAGVENADEDLERRARDKKDGPVYGMFGANEGKPEEMGLSAGWSVEQFLAACHTTAPDGSAYANLCIGCDKFHREVLGGVLQQISQQRRASRTGMLASSGRG